MWTRLIEAAHGARAKGLIRRQGFEDVPAKLDTSDWGGCSCGLARAFEVQGALAERGHHRLPIPDLIIAAAAEHAELAVLHHDADFDRICAVTDQPHEWVVPRGSV